jgi:hypothetical protein
LRRNYVVCLSKGSDRLSIYSSSAPHCEGRQSRYKKVFDDAWRALYIGPKKGVSLSGNFYQLVVASSQKLLEHSIAYSCSPFLDFNPCWSNLCDRIVLKCFLSGFQISLFSNDTIGERPSYNQFELPVGTVLAEITLYDNNV